MRKCQSIIFAPCIIAIMLAVSLPVFHDTASATEWFVSLSGSNETGTGSSGNPWRTIFQAVINCGAGDTITVMSGTYPDGLTYLYGEIYLRSRSGPGATILTGSGETGIFYMDNYSFDIIIDGFTFRDAGHTAIDIYSGGANITLKNNQFINCSADSAGGAIYLVSANAAIYNNLFKNNSALEGGGAIYAGFSTCQIYNNVFDSNYISGGYGWGGAVSIYGTPYDSTNTVVQNNVFRYNMAANGAGLAAQSSTLLIYNNLFYRNAASNSGGGLRVNYNYFPGIYNNIFANNSPDGMATNDATLYEYSHNDYYGNTPYNDCDGCPSVGGIVTYYVDPLFVDAENQDYHLTDNSQLINKGLSNLPDILGMDFENQKRVLSTEIDVGPDEYADCSIAGDFAALTTTDSCPGLLVNFSAEGLLEGYWDSLTWIFGDGGFAYNTIDPEHQYMNTGSFTVELLLTTPCTTVAVSKPGLVNIMNKPLPNFTADQISGCTPLTVAFQNLTAGPVNEYVWFFGDGRNSNEVNPLHEYANPGTYAVRLYALNDCGEDSLVKVDYIEVLSGAIADFSAEPLAGSAPLRVYFTDLSEFDPIEWHWNFGDNSGGDIEQDPDHRYLFPGIFNVRLVCANECGTPDTLTKEAYITVYGFETVLYNTISSDKYTFKYEITFDSLYGLFDTTIALKASLFQNPTRGTVALSFGDSSVNLFDSTYLSASLSKDVPRGDYDIVLTATGARGLPVDTLMPMLQFTSTSDPIIDVIPDTIDFGQVPEDSIKNMNLRIENSSFFGDNLLLTVYSVSAPPGVFSVVNPGQFQLDAIGFRDIPVSFAPGGLGNFQGSVLISSDDPAYPQLIVPLSGQGVLERTPPAVDSTRPANLEAEYDVTRHIYVFLSEPIDTSISAALEYDNVGSGLADIISVFSAKSGQDIYGNVIYSEDPPLIVFMPANGFRIKDSIVATVSGNVVDLVGNSLDGNGNGVGEGSPTDDYIFSFTTGLAVYPGDANNDGIVNEMDVLPLGVYWAITGEARNMPVSWNRQSSKSWNPVGATYADCDGNGIINQADLSVIKTNWGLSHEIEGLPTAFTIDDLESSSESFDAINNYLNGADLGENGIKIRQILANYISASDEIEKFSLGRNFPNPFNPITTMNFTVPISCHVQIEVYNVLGQRVKLLVDDYLAAGLNTVTWDGTDSNAKPVPSGVYFYRMTAEEFTEVRKMLLIR